MKSQLNITEARRLFLDLPERLGPGQAVEVIRHRRPVLKIVRLDTGKASPSLSLLDSALKMVKKPRKMAPKMLATRYKAYLYGKKH